MVDINNRSIKGCHGMIMEKIYHKVCELALNADVFVREAGYTDRKLQSQIIFKVHGVCDLAIWQTRQAVFEEIAPSRVKKLVAGSGKASKQEVADALAQFVGAQEYACDDQSDAVAVGVSWLLLNGWKYKM